MFRTIVRYLVPHVGRVTSAQLRWIAENLNPQGVFVWGPVMVLVDLPRRFWKVDPEPTLEDFNQAMKALMDQVQAGVITLPEVWR